MVSRRRRRERELMLPTGFKAKFWEHMDQRAFIVREVKRRYELLKEDTGSNSTQRDLLCQRLAFLSIMLESAECEAVESGEFDPGSYSQTVNTLLGILRSLGLDKKVQQAGSLKAYVEGSTKRRKA